MKFCRFKKVLNTRQIFLPFKKKKNYFFYFKQRTPSPAHLYLRYKSRYSMCANVRFKTSFPKIYKRIIVPQAIPYKIQEYQKVFSASGTAPLGPLGLLRYSSINCPLRSNISAEKNGRVGKTCQYSAINSAIRTADFSHY